MDIGWSLEMATREALGGLIEITLGPFDNVWRINLHIKIQNKNPMGKSVNNTSKDV
jgi:hypothetical protein